MAHLLIATQGGGSPGGRVGMPGTRHGGIQSWSVPVSVLRWLICTRHRRTSPCVTFNKTLMQALSCAATSTV